MKFPRFVKNRNFWIVTIYVALIIFLAYFLHDFLKKHSLSEIMANLEAIPTHKKVAAALLTLLSFFILALYDFLGLKYVKAQIDKKQVFLVSFISYAFGNTIGMYVLASGSIRYRYYSSCGLSISQISKVVIFTAVTLWIGFGALAGIGFTFFPLEISADWAVFNIQYVGIVILFLYIMYMLLLVRSKPLNFYNTSFTFPSFSIGVLQTLVSAADWIVFGSVLYVLMPESAGINYFTFINIFLLAQAVALISHVPGGLLVFEAILLAFLPEEAISPAVGALLIFRITYYVVPLLTAALLMAVSEIVRLRAAIFKPVIAVGRVYNTFTPTIMAVVVGIGGAYLLFSGALPINPDRMPFVAEVIPVALLETSHMLASMIGLGLIILSRGLFKKLDLAFRMTILLLLFGTVLSFFKGSQLSTFGLQIFIILVLIPTRSLFYKKSSFFSEVLTKEWLLTILMVILAFTWLGFFAYRHVEYGDELWWTFAFDAAAPRFLRTLVAISVLAGSVALLKLFKPSKPSVAPVEEDAEKIINEVISSSRNTNALLAYLGDKKFIFSSDHKGFLMYAEEGRSFISMGDPFGSEEAAEELIINFRKLSSKAGYRAVFYEIGTDYIPNYLDAGFKIFKIGEQARVNLSEFTLEGSHWSSLRNTMNKLEKNGAVFKIIEANEAVEYFPQFKKISDEWLSEKQTSEKRFSLGNFDEKYLKKFPFAVVFVDDKPVAFANVWSTSSIDEISIDLMRYGTDAPNGIMDFLFINLMLYAQNSGYKHFNLGMAPLSGFELNNFSPMWNRVASTMFKHGERFYNFKGLRSFKEKFKPEWEPKYVAVPSALSLPYALRNIASLISGKLLKRKK